MREFGGSQTLNHYIKTGGEVRGMLFPPWVKVDRRAAMDPNVVLNRSNNVKTKSSRYARNLAKVLKGEVAAQASTQAAQEAGEEKRPSKALLFFIARMSGDMAPVPPK